MVVSYTSHAVAVTAPVRGCKHKTLYYDAKKLNGRLPLFYSHVGWRDTIQTVCGEGRSIGCDCSLAGPKKKKESTLLLCVHGFCMDGLDEEMNRDHVWFILLQHFKKPGRLTDQENGISLVRRIAIVLLVQDRLVVHFPTRTNIAAELPPRSVSLWRVTAKRSGAPILLYHRELCLLPQNRRSIGLGTCGKWVV